VSQLTGVNCASVLLQLERHVINTEGIKRRAREKEHFEFVVAIYLVLSLRFYSQVSTKRHSTYSACRPAKPARFFKTSSTNLNQYRSNKWSVS
jgi:polyphosphate kinase 2 (PPK2 family)